MTATLVPRAGPAAPAPSGPDSEPDDPAPPPAAPPPDAAAAAARLRHGFAATRVGFTWFGVRKALSAEQKAEAAERFGAEGRYLSAAKKLLDTTHEAFGRVTAVRTQVLAYWRGLSLPFPEPGVRLVRQADVAAFDARLTAFRGELAAAVSNLDAQYAPLRAAAAERLGRLYDPADYPPTLRGLFAVEFDFPSVDAPDYLRRLDPRLYEQERRRVAARFDEAARLAEAAFAAEFGRLVSHLTERLTAGPDGGRKVFRDSAVTGLRDFFARFKSLSVTGDGELDRLVETARRSLAGVEPAAVRDDAALRQQVAARLSAVQSSLDGLLVDAPRRRVLRIGRPTAPVDAPAGEDNTGGTGSAVPH